MKESTDAVSSSNGQNDTIDSPQKQSDNNKIISLKLDDAADEKKSELDETDRADLLTKTDENTAKSPVLKYHYKDDQWSPLNTHGKKQYDSDFLRSLQHDPMSKVKPNVTEGIDFLLHQGVGVIQTPTRQHDLMPNFAKGSSPRGPISKRGSQQGKPSPKANKGSSQGPKSNVIHLSLSLHEDVKLNETENAWKPAHLKKSETLTEEERKTEELKKTVRGILNKLTPEKFDKLVGDLKELKIDTVARLNDVIDLVFEKAVDEPNFAVFYACMCKELMGLKVPEDTDQSDNPAPEKSQKSFRYLIINRCQTEFENEKKFENSPKRIDMLKEIEECNDPEKKKELSLTLEEEERKVRMKSVGNIRFIGELYRLKILGSKTMATCIETLLSKIQEETLECLCRLLTTIGGTLETQSSLDMSEYFHKIEQIISKRDGKVSSRVRFMLQDVVELRRNNWVPRRVEIKAKTLDQIEQEAEEEHKHIERINATPKGPSRRDDRGGRGRDRGGRHGDDGGGWTTPQSRLRQQNIDPLKLSKLRAQNITETKLGPSTVSWSRGSSTKSAASRSVGSPMAMSPVNPTFTGVNKFSALESSESELSPRSPTRPAKDVRFSKGASIERSSFQSAKRQDSRSGDSNAQDTKQVEIEPISNEAKPQSPVPPPEPLTEAEVNKIGNQIRNCLEEYYTEVTKYVHLITEFQEKYTARHMPTVLHKIFDVVLDESQEKKHILTRDLLFNMVKNELITIDLYVDCLTEHILSIASDLFIDYPKLYHYIAIWLVPHMTYQKLTLKRLHKGSERVIEDGHGDKLLGSVLKRLVGETSQAFVKQLWTEGGQAVADWMPPDRAASWLSEYDLQFLVSGDVQTTDSAVASPPAVCPLTADETQKMLFNFLQRNQDQDFVTGWVRSNVGASATEGWFLRALTKAVCDDALLPPGETAERIPRFGQMSEKRICDHVALLIRYVENKEERELECLFAIQQLLDDYEHPSGVALQLFDSFSKYEVISNEAFLAWEQDKSPHEQKGKGVMTKSLHSFFVMLKEQDIESGDED